MICCNTSFETKLISLGHAFNLIHWFCPAGELVHYKSIDSGSRRSLKRTSLTVTLSLKVQAPVSVTYNIYDNLVNGRWLEFA